MNAKRSPPPPAASPPPALSPSSASAGPAARSALVVEDEEGMRRILETCLEEKGYEVVAEANGSRAWDLARRAAFPVVLVDWNLPGLTGIDLCRRLRALPAYADSVILVITGRTDPADLVAALEAGADDYVTKPFRLESLEVRLTIAENQLRPKMLRRRAEEELRRSHDLLEERVEARTRQLGEAHRAVRQSEKRYRQLIDASLDGVVSTDLEGYIEDCNRAFEEMLGYRLDEMRHTHFFRFTPARWHAWEREIIERGIHGQGRSGLYEKEYIRADGTVFPIELSAYLIRDEDGTPSGMWAFVRDITERRQAEESLRRRLAMEELVADVSRRFAVIDSQESGPAIHEALRGLARYLETDRSSLLAFSADGKAVAYGYEWHERELPPVLPELCGLSLASYAYAMERFRRLEPLRWARLAELPPEADPERELSARLGCTALLAVPLHIEGELAGFLAVSMSGRERAWDGEDVRLLQMVADLSGSLLARGRTGDVLRLQRDLATEISHSVTLEEAMRACIRAALRIPSVDSAGIYLVEEDGAAVLAAHAGFSDGFVRAAERFGPNTPHERLIRKGQPVYEQYRELREHLGIPSGPVVDREGLKAVGVVPVIHEGQAVASFNIASRRSERIPLYARHALEVIAGQVGSALARLRAEKALRASEAKYRYLFENAHVGVLRGRLVDGVIVDANQRAAEILGLVRARDMVGVPMHDLFAEGDIARETLERVRAGGAIPNREARLRRRDGGEAWIQWAAWRGTDGISVEAVMLDVSELKRAREEAAIRQRQLVQADKLASLGTLVAGVAHEVNNPNSFVMLNAPLLEEMWNAALPALEAHAERTGEETVGRFPLAFLRDRVPRLLSGINEGSRRIKRIVSDLKDYARQDVADTREEVDVRALADAAVSLVWNKLKRSTTRFSLHCAPDLAPVRGNYQRLEQVLINLLINACEALPETDRAIEMRVDMATDPEEGPVPAVRIRVRDEGEGIPEALLPRITDPFFTTKQESGGTGLGLSISAGIVADHDGVLRFASEPGRGTEAVLLLPALEATTEERP